MELVLQSLVEALLLDAFIGVAAIGGLPELLAALHTRWQVRMVLPPGRSPAGCGVSACSQLREVRAEGSLMHRAESPSARQRSTRRSACFKDVTRRYGHSGEMTHHVER